MEFINKLKDKDAVFLWTGLNYEEKKGRRIWFDESKQQGQSEFCCPETHYQM
ncbi:unnamed protein product [Eretmochelys imbricata]